MGDFRRTKRPSSRKISSQPRYDRFDTSPYMFNSFPKAANLWEQPLGTAKNNDIKFFKKARKIRGFLRFEN